jgi:carbon-monoxide dehydrogenase large subunit
VTRHYRMNRQSGAPLEGRAVLAYRDHRLDEVVIYASTQTPHMVRVAIAENLGVDERSVRVVAPDVGGGFGPKARLYPEEIILAALALTCGCRSHNGRFRSAALRFLVSSLPGLGD